ncbi:MAG: hypothetical protein WC247_07540 [Porticoccaceae bacterium]|jgi:hypothetical protein
MNGARDVDAHHTAIDEPILAHLHRGVDESAPPPLARLTDTGVAALDAVLATRRS